MARGAGKDAIAEQANPTATTSPDTDATANPVQIFSRAVVVEVLYDLTAFSDEDMEELKALIDSPDMLKTAPRNSIIARIITGGADKKAPDATEPPTEEERAEQESDDIFAGLDGEAETSEPGPVIGGVGVLCYPFFPPHLCFPVKPGEQVWVVQDSPDTPTKIQYWMCRIPEPAQVDDINFTHGDRKFVGSLAEPTSKEKAEASQAETSATGELLVTSPGDDQAAQQPPAAAANESAVPQQFDLDFDGIDDRIFGFPNGTDVEDGFTLKGMDGYENIVNVAIAYDQFHRQHVPRFTKRPGDMVIQGSNNTLICLGEQRGWGANTSDGTELDLPWDPEYSNATFDEGKIEGRKDNPWGAIDLVAGRGRHDWRIRSKTEQLPPMLTAPRCIFNTPGTEPMMPNQREAWVEVNKNPQAVEEAEQNRLDAPAEGDPDFAYDAARVWVSHSGEPDKLFNLDTFGTTIPTRIGPEGTDLNITTAVAYPSSVVAKADEIRIVARKLEANDPVDGSPEVNGSIRIIKQGVPDDDMACIYLLADGTVQVSGSKIYLGRHPENGGKGGGPADGESQPYIMYQEFQDLIDALCGDLQTFCDNVLSHVTPGYGAPSPQLNSAAAKLKAAMDERKAQVPSVQSERIFGE